MSIQNSINTMLGAGAAMKTFAQKRLLPNDVTKATESNSQAQAIAQAKAQQKKELESRMEQIKKQVRSNFGDIGVLSPQAQKVAIGQLPDLQKLLTESADIEKKLGGNK